MVGGAWALVVMWPHFLRELSVSTKVNSLPGSSILTWFSFWGSDSLHWLKRLSQLSPSLGLDVLVGAIQATLVLGYKLPFLSFYQERFNIKRMCAAYIFIDACIYSKMMFPLVNCQKPWLLQEVIFDCNCLKVQKSNSLYLQIQKRILPVPLKEAERNECLHLSPPGFEWAL